MRSRQAASGKPSVPAVTPYAALIVLSLLFAGGWMGGCASGPAMEAAPVLEPAAVRIPDLEEIAVPEGEWRPHRLSGCREDADVPVVVEKYLGTCSQFFREGSGSDGMIELEMALQAGHRHPLILLTLGQLYLMAGQGMPELMPVEGPAGDVGDWSRNKVRLLGRARSLLEEAAPLRPDDAAVDYLLADVARAAGDHELAADMVAMGMAKCTGGRSFAILQLYQELYRYPPRFLGGPAPAFPQEALVAGIGGEVVLDLLLSPAGEVRQIATVESPHSALTQEAGASLRKGRFEAARVGKYPIWSWLRVTTAFNLAGE